MFKFIKQIFISTMMFFGSLSSMNPLECVSISNQECKVGPEIVNVNSNMMMICLNNTCLPSFALWEYQRTIGQRKQSIVFGTSAGGIYSSQARLLSSCLCTLSFADFYCHICLFCLADYNRRLLCIAVAYCL